MKYKPILSIVALSIDLMHTTVVKATPSSLFYASAVRRRSTIAAFHSLHQPRCSTSRKNDMISGRKYVFRTASSSLGKSTTDLMHALDEELLDPYDILRALRSKDDVPYHDDIKPTIPLPSQLSPSSLDRFHKCPQAFFFQDILKLKPDPPTTPALARGTCCHTALEQVFELKPADRTLDNLKNLFRRAWQICVKRGPREAGTSNEDAVQNKNDYDCLFRSDEQSYDIDAEIEWGKISLDLLANYYELEDPKSLSPITREMWVHARFYVDDTPFVIRGIIDRIDMFVDEQSGKVQLQIVDYKTGKKPHFKYSDSVNERIKRENFFNMRLYALILWKTIVETERRAKLLYTNPSEDISDGESIKPEYKFRLSWEVQQKVLRALGKDGETNHIPWTAMLDFLPLRLLFLTSHPDDESVNHVSMESELGKASYLDAALQPNFHQVLHETEQDVLSIYSDIKKLVGKLLLMLAYYYVPIFFPI